MASSKTGSRLTPSGDFASGCNTGTGAGMTGAAEIAISGATAPEFAGLVEVLAFICVCLSDISEVLIDVSLRAMF